MGASEIVGHFAINPGTGRETVFPLLPGSIGIFDPKLISATLASNFLGPVNWEEGFFTPLLNIRTRLFSNWFNVGNIDTMFRRAAGLFSQLQSGLGVTQWQYAGQTARCWVNSKLANLTLIWGGTGPIEARLTILPYGYSYYPREILGTLAGREWQSCDVSYGTSGLSSVVNGMISINNNLAPNRSSPSYNSPDGFLYPKDYFCSYLTFTARTRHYARGVAAFPLTTQVGGFVVQFNESNPFGNTVPPNVAFGMQVKQPVTTEAYTGQPAAMITYDYEGINPDQFTPMLRVNQN